MNKTILLVALVASGLLFAFLNYKLKPRPKDEDIRDQAKAYGRTVEWENHIAPDFEFTTLSGDHFKLSEHVGKQVIVLNFFATWCGPCRAEMPELNRYYLAHQKEGFLLLAIDSEEKEDRVSNFMSELKLNFDAGIDNGPIQKQYGVVSFPTTVVIGADGKVQLYEIGVLANADVAFDNVMSKNRPILQAGKGISQSDYLAEAQKLPALPVKDLTAAATKTDPKEKPLDERGKRIAARMDCPCGCTDKVAKCTCSRSKLIKEALTNEDFKTTSDDDIIKQLDKRYCVAAMGAM